MQIGAINHSSSDDGTQIIQRIIHTRHCPSILRRRKLNQIQRRARGRKRAEETQHKSSTYESAQRGRGSRDNSADTYTCAADEYGPASTVPITNPDEQGANHLSDLENGKDNAGATVAFGWEVVVIDVALHSVDRAHEGAIVAVHS